MVKSTRIVRCVVDSTNWKVDLRDTWKNHTRRRTGRVEKVVESTRIVRCVVDSTNWKVDLQDT